MEQRLLIAVIGGSSCPPEVAAAAEEVGRLLAEQGAVVVCGGLTGVMEAVCKGARQAGGHTIGILPGSERSDANSYIEFALPTGMGHARNALVARSAHAVIAIDGSYGTLSEMAFALAFGTPIIGLNTWEIGLEGQQDTGVIRVASPQEAVERALAAAQTHSS